MTNMKVLCIADYYLPGYKAGGPIRTIANMCDVLAGEVAFSIVTRDRDLGDTQPYVDLSPNKWYRTNNASVFYANSRTFAARAVAGILNTHDALYLNSFFSYRGSIEPYLRFRKHTRILLAPRGEFSPGALAIGRYKKRLFLSLAQMLKLYRDVHWHASTIEEAEDIQRVFPEAARRIHLAADPVALDLHTPQTAREAVGTQPFKLVFISRISPKKNLDGLLQILVPLDVEISLSIFGPQEDGVYWQRCQDFASTLPPNIKVEYRGTLRPEEVSEAFAQNDLFVFPTHGENFGHVVFESLRAGTPVLVSDRTPWKGDPAGAITVLPLDSPEAWQKALREAAGRTLAERQAVRAAAGALAHQFAQDDQARLDNLRMFASVAG